MKVTALRVTRAEGVSKKTGNPFIMYQLDYISPFESFSNKPRDYSAQDEKDGKPWYGISGYGVTVTSVNLDPEAFTSFSRLTWPCSIELLTTLEVRSGQPQVLVTGFKQAELKAA